MNYHEFLTELFKIKRFGKTPNLLVMEKILEKLDNPHKKLKIIHIAGTNGKGSVSNYISSSLIEKGYKVGLFTSPFIHKFNERFKINNNNIDDFTLAKLGTEIFEISNSISYDVKQFDIITAIGLYWFYLEKCDYVVLESGMGGRNDSTNIITPVLSVITTIDLDHTKILGETREEIAYEKAGIIKENIPLVYYPTDLEHILIRECNIKNSSFKTIAEPEIVSVSESGSTFLYKEEFSINMLGKYQVYNACVAIEALKTLGIEHKFIKKGLEKMKFEGRFERISDNPSIYIDGGHNPQGARSIKETIKFHNIENPTLVIAMYKEKDALSYLENIKGAGEIILTSFDDEMCHNPYELSERFGFKVMNLPDIADMVNKSSENKNFIFCGSLYQISQIKNLFAKTR